MVISAQPPKLCDSCKQNSPVMRRPKSGEILCRECFFAKFESEIHWTIAKAGLLKPGEKVAIAASGGKDSTVLAHVISKLNRQYDYGIELVLLSIDEGITGYRDDSLETVKRNQKQYSLPLTVLSYRDLYGWSMDQIVEKVGLKNNCTFCGVFRRQALDRGAHLLSVDKILTGHNADDVAETVLMNILRGDVARLQRCTQIVTGSEGTIPRCKPLKFAYEKEIVMYAHYKKLDYFSTECVYSPNAYRGHVRSYLKDLERIRPRSVLDIIVSGESFAVKAEVQLPQQGVCQRCGYISSMAVCKACILLEGLNTGDPRLGIRKFSSRSQQQLPSAKKNQAAKTGRTDAEAKKRTIIIDDDSNGSLVGEIGEEDLSNSLLENGELYEKKLTLNSIEKAATNSSSASNGGQCGSKRGGGQGGCACSEEVTIDF